MQARLQQHSLSAAMIVVGLGLSVWTGQLMMKREELDVPLNPCGINRSPYGEVFAMAMQGPINRDFNAGMYGATPEEMAQRTKDLKPNKPGSLLIIKPDPNEEAKPAPAMPNGILNQMQHVIEQMRIGHNRRTNPLPASNTLKFFLRRKAEDKLRLAYQLDPSHYANYAALHFFLIEGVGTRPELTPKAGKLAQDTIEYCLSIEHDPRPALTAAAACMNILHLMFKAEFSENGKKYDPDEMQAVIDQLDSCIAKYQQISAEWDKNGNWQRISPQQATQCFDRIDFNIKMRDAADKTVQKIRDTYAK